MDPIIVKWENTRPCIGTKSGTIELNFLSSGSLVGEMVSMVNGVADSEWKYTEGGLLYLIGEHHIFWSLFIHYKATSLCFPASEPGMSWTQHSWLGKELVRTYTPLESNLVIAYVEIFFV